MRPRSVVAAWRLLLLLPPRSREAAAFFRVRAVMNRHDAFAVLAMPRSAQEEDVRRAYKRLALLHHPDKNPGNSTATEKFQRIGEDNDMLSRPGNVGMPELQA